MRRGGACLAVLLAAAAHVSLAAEPADGRDLEAGVRLVMSTAGGVPANDVSGYGIHGRYRLGASQRGGERGAGVLGRDEVGLHGRPVWTGARLGA